MSTSTVPRQRSPGSLMPLHRTLRGAGPCVAAGGRVAAECRCCGEMAPTGELAHACCPLHCALPASPLPEGCGQAAGLDTYRRTREGKGKEGRGKGKKLCHAEQGQLSSWWRLHKGTEAARGRDGVR